MVARTPREVGCRASCQSSPHLSRSPERNVVLECEEVENHVHDGHHLPGHTRQHTHSIATKFRNQHTTQHKTTLTQQHNTRNTTRQHHNIRHTHHARNTTRQHHNIRHTHHTAHSTQHTTHNAQHTNTHNGRSKPTSVRPNSHGFVSDNMRCIKMVSSVKRTER